MLKDPNDTSLSPYELLSLTTDASCPEVQKALPRFMRDRKNLPRLGQAQEAVRKLQNAKARAAIDIWHYHIDVSHIDGLGSVPAQPDLREFHRLSIAPVESLYCDLHPEAMTADFREISINPIKFSDIKAFDGIDTVRLRPHFDI